MIGEGGIVPGTHPSAALVKKIDEKSALLKQLKAKVTKKQQPAQKEIKAKLKVLANELVAYLAAHVGEIRAVSAKIKLNTLVTDAKKAVLQAEK